MKKMLFLLCILFCLIVPAVSGDVITAKLSAGTGSPETPPQNASVYINEAKAAVAERNWTNALLLTTRGVTWYPDNADLLCIQGYIYRKMGQLDKSVEIVSKSIPLDPKPVRYANRGYGYLALGDTSAALADAESGISLNANYTTSYGVKALALKSMGRNVEALAAIDTALALEPENGHYWHVKGNILAANGNCPGARESLEISLKLDPDYSLPYPGFIGARENLLTLNTTCNTGTSKPVTYEIVCWRDRGCWFNGCSSCSGYKKITPFLHKKQSPTLRCSMINYHHEKTSLERALRLYA